MSSFQEDDCGWHYHKKISYVFIRKKTLLKNLVLDYLGDLVLIPSSMLEGTRFWVLKINEVLR